MWPKGFSVLAITYACSHNACSYCLAEQMFVLAVTVRLSECLLLQSLYEQEGSWHALVVTFWKLPLIYLAMMAVRGLCICLLNPIFRLAGSHMSVGEILFSTVGGLRGAISLILAQMLVTQSHPNPEQRDQQRVQAQVKSPLPPPPPPFGVQEGIPLVTVL